MKTKTIPFDLETAKKIQAGEIKGKIYVSDDTHNKIRIICFDRKAAFPKIITLEEDKMGVEWVRECNLKGEFLATMSIPSNEQYAITRCIVLEVPDNEPQFKPFAKVLARNADDSQWNAELFSHISGKLFFCVGGIYTQCIPYEGNEHLLGTTDNSKEE